MITETAGQHIGGLSFVWTGYASELFKSGIMAMHLASQKEPWLLIVGPLISLLALPAMVLAIPADIIAAPFRTRYHIKGNVRGRLSDTNRNPLPNTSLVIVSTSWSLFEKPKNLILRVQTTTDSNGVFSAPIEGFFGEERTIYIDASSGERHVFGHLNIQLAGKDEIRLVFPRGGDGFFDVHEVAPPRLETPNHLLQRTRAGEEAHGARH